MPGIALVFEGQEVGEIRPNSVFTCDKDSVSREVFGYSDTSHPGVAYFHGMGDWFIGGPVVMNRRVSLPFSGQELTPAETRQLFDERNWSTVVGFQTRNVPHRAHEHLQRIGSNSPTAFSFSRWSAAKNAGTIPPKQSSPDTDA